MTQKIDLARVLKYALQMEETARGFFLENSKRFSHGAVAETFDQYIHMPCGG
jgi:rubrerythrin